ncbi:hypothetical protein [Lysinibacillus sp. fls2-241-R2A-57]|uniref:hypothetical protein n=1 Tax=Lysinibacillus sp. fls2-241-R2A-57 TaxID=3040292 RepID=UPI0025569AA3|nr:hypothetical protein [Lysinibacillus sp. fls2-241-R2A-57]
MGTSGAHRKPLESAQSERKSTTHFGEEPLFSKKRQFDKSNNLLITLSCYLLILGIYM